MVFPFAYGREQTWVLLAGPADLGPVDLATLKRRSSPNDALQCRDNFCPAAIADVSGNLYKVSVAEVAAALDSGLAFEADLVRVDDGSDLLYRRYVQRSSVLKFPDTIDVRFFPLSDDQAYMAIYSRAQLGYADFEANLKRISRWSNYTEDLPHED
jgi:hypothetical protein